MWIHSGMEPAHATPPDPTTTVALALPGLLIAEALARVMRDHQLQVVGCHDSHRALLDGVRRSRPTVAVVDAELLAPDAGAALAALAAACPATRLVVLAAAFDEEIARAVRQAGVRGVILRSSPAAAAVEAVVRVSRGLTSFPAATRATADEP